MKVILLENLTGGASNENIIILDGPVQIAQLPLL